MDITMQPLFVDCSGEYLETKQEVSDEVDPLAVTEEDNKQLVEYKMKVEGVEESGDTKFKIEDQSAVCIKDEKRELIVKQEVSDEVDPLAFTKEDNKQSVEYKMKVERVEESADCSDYKIEDQSAVCIKVEECEIIVKQEIIEVQDDMKVEKYEATSDIKENYTSLKKKMSDSDGNSSKRDDTKQICRNFLRNICQRGSGCKFLHTREKERTSSGQLVTFCHDYQNVRCTRYDCKFVHCTNEEEEHYRQTGELPTRMMDEPWNKWVAAEVLSSKMGEKIPVCRDLLNNECRRRNCRYGYLNLREVEPPHSDYEYNSALFHRRDDRSRSSYEEYEPNFKRRRFMDAPPSFQNGHFRPPDRALFVLEEENAILRQRVAELKKRVDDLQATNEFLLELNAQMRNEKGAPSLTAVTVPAVTITNTAQMQAAQAPNHPVMNAAIRTVTASVATVPVSIAAVTATPCSIATVSMAPVPIPPAVVTMAQPSGQNPSGGPQALPMSISEPPGPMVSYPIMTGSVLHSDMNH